MPRNVFFIINQIKLLRLSNNQFFDGTIDKVARLPTESKVAI